MAKAKKDSYGEGQIQVLEGLEAVRKRPGMYIGGTGLDGLHHLTYEIVDNAIDEALAGFCNEITVTLGQDEHGHYVSVQDNGRGIPIEKHPVKKIPTVRVVMEILHAGGKFGGGGYKISGGLHGVGISVVNALSKRVEVYVVRDKKKYGVVYRDGGHYVEDYFKPTPKGNVSGTYVKFYPDEEIFGDLKTDFDKLKRRFRQTAFLTPQVKITLVDAYENGQETVVLHYENGLVDYIDYLTKNDKPLPNVGKKKIVNISGESNEVLVEVALTYSASYSEKLYCFANNIYNPDGGTHLSGFRRALTRVLNDFAKNNNLFKKADENLTGDDVRDGLTAVIAVKLGDPQFEGQTKSKLGSPHVQGAVETVLYEKLKQHLEDNPALGKLFIQKCLDTQRIRMAAKRAKDLAKQKSSVFDNVLVGKLAYCTSRNPEEKELFIVEGDSAGGCFTGDTLIKLVGGESISFKDLVLSYQKNKNGYAPYCITVREDGSFSSSPILHPRVTKRNAELVTVILSNGKDVRCTPDHRFMLSNYEYIEAKDLVHGMVLKSSGSKKVNVVDVIPLPEREDVYDIEVPETHNFLLDCGVVVHNSAKQGRNRHFQAILPLKGKILNVEKTTETKIYSNDEIKALVTAIGTGIDKSFDITSLNYSKIIILSDADVDGSHIRALLLTFFIRRLEKLVLDGHLWIAQPPLYQLKVGKNSEYIFTQTDLKNKISSLKDGSYQVVRFKGLGEMDPEELWETTMNPATRRMKQVFIEDIEDIDTIIRDLMGTRVENRKKFIERHSREILEKEKMDTIERLLKK